MPFGSRPSAMLFPGRPLGLGIDERAEEFTRLLLDAPHDDVQGTGREWLRRRYEEIVPLVLPSALTSVEHGEPLDPACIEALRAVAVESADEGRGDVSVVLRGARPALRVFAVVVQTVSLDQVDRAVLAMSRASLVAQELGSCWAEAWWARRVALGKEASGTAPDLSAAAMGESPGPVVAGPVGVETAEDLQLVARAEHLDVEDERMLELAARGLSTAEISTETAYSRQAVAWRLGRLMKSWRAPNRTALVAFAFAKGWLAPPGDGPRRRRPTRGDGDADDR